MDASLTPPQPVHRQDYRAPDWLVPDISLSFELDPACTRVAAVLSVTRNGDHDRPLRLDRSEEHTSELQSLMRISYAVFCLQKKNTLRHHIRPMNRQRTVTRVVLRSTSIFS